MAAAQPATCTRCSVDCSTSERYRDDRGRIFCTACAAAIRAAGAPAILTRDPGSTETLHEQPPAELTPKLTPAQPTPIQTGPTDRPSDDIIPIAEDPAPASPTPRNCSNCGIPLGDNIICSACGLNSSTGRMLGSDAPPGEGKVCRNCGYSLAGIGTLRCPECGTYNGRPSKRKRDRLHSQDVTRAEYINPTVLFAIGAALTITIQLAFGDGLIHASSYLLSYLIAIPLGIIVFLFFCMFWLGFDAPVHLIALRLAAIFAITDALDSFLHHICFTLPLPIIGPWFLVLVVYIGMLTEMLDLELQDAVLVGLITYTLRLGAFVGMLYLLGVDFGYHW